MLHRYLLFDWGTNLSRLYYGTDTRADALLMGCVFALVPVVEVGAVTKRWLKRVGVISAVGLACLMVFARFNDGFLYCGGFTGVALLAGIVIFVAANWPPRILSVVLKWSLLRWFGHISYGLYLWHWLVVRNTSLYYVGYLEPWAKLATAVGIAAASFYILERPFNRLKSRFAVSTITSRSTLPTTNDEKSISPASIPLTNYQ